MRIYHKGFLADGNGYVIARFPFIEERRYSRFAYMLSCLRIYVTPTADSLHCEMLVDYGDDASIRKQVTHMVSIEFDMTPPFSGATSVALFVDNTRLLYESLPDVLKDTKGVGTDAVSYIVKIVKLFDEVKLE
jgi:hypothetical protein